MANETLKISRLYKDLDLSFTRNPVTGDVSKKIDVNAVKQSLNILMQTNFYERPFAPEKGANLRAYLFEPMSNLVANVLQSTVRNMIASYEPRVRIETIVVRPNFDMDSYEIELRFFVVGISSPQTLVAQLKRLR
jgi:phage baseplate assembly protein W